MSPLNFCRQMTKQFASKIQIPSFPALNKQILSHALDLAAASQKFLLPDGGRVFDDREFRALDDAKPLRLPFPIVALEYRSTDKATIRPGDYATSKRIVFARERDDCIAVMAVCFWDSMGVWAPLPEVWLCKTGYLRRAQKDAFGNVGIAVGFTEMYSPSGGMAKPQDVMDEVGALVCFLNALQCRNVSAARLDARKPARRAKDALPFDSYHVLMVDSGRVDAATGEPVGERRSPREHLRRGHIRVYASGLKLWINATVVNAACGGKVSKDYAMRLAA